jgi:hypothetical protein
MLSLRHLAVAALILCAAIRPTPGSARLAVVSPDDSRGVPMDYDGDIPPGQGALLPLSWDYVEELVPLMVLGAEVHEGCYADDPLTLPVAVAQALAKMTSMDLDGAVEQLDGLITNLPCLDKPASARELARVYYYRGAALAFLGDSRGAAASMSQALAVDASMEPDANLPPEINDIFEQQRKNKTTRCDLVIVLPPWATYRVDGREGATDLNNRSAAFLQWQQPDGRWRSLLLDELGTTVVMGTPSGLKARMGAADDAHTARLAADLGEQLARPLKVGGVVLWDGSDSALFWDGDANTTEWLGERATAIVANNITSGRHTPPPTDALRLAVGGGLGLVSPYSYAILGADVTVRLYRSLCLGVGVDLGLPLNESRERVVLPLLHGGPRLRAGGKVHPFVGLDVRLGFDDKPGKVWGLVALGLEGGLDIPLSKVLMIRASACGGAFVFPFIEPQVHAKIGLVVGI